MRLLEMRHYRGPNLYGYRPVIRMKLDLEELEDNPTTALGDFVDRLVELVPSLEEHTCSFDERGGFIRRMREGTWIGHVAEHLAIELQCLAGTPVTYGKTRGVEPGVYYVIYSYQQEEVGTRAGELALRTIANLLPPHLPSSHKEPGFNFTLELEDLVRLAERLAFGPSTQSLVKAAEARGISWLRLDDNSLVQFGQGKYQRRIQATITSETRYIAVEIAQDKSLTARMLGDMGLPVPRQRLVEEEDEAVRAAEEIGYPVVIKPLDASHGRGVSLNLKTAEEVRQAFQGALKHRDSVLVENFVAGNDHRILVVNGQVVAVAERVPGHVVGDGVHTIAELVDIINMDPRRGVGHEKVLTRLEFDQQAERLMQLAGVTVQTVLPLGERLYLRSTGNLSTGGTAVDRTDQIHYVNREMAVLAARVIGLDIAGIDFLSPDISRPYNEVGGAIVEVNAAPGFRMHVAPSEGRARDVAGPVMDMLFPPNTPSRILLMALTGTNGKTTTARMAAHILKMAGHRVGLTTTDGVYIDGERFLRGDMTGPWSAQVVLKNPTVDAAILETARGGILREGLGWDRCDVGAVLNVSEDHLGLRGINTVEDLAYVKALIVEVIKPEGWGVLNADDPLVAAMASQCEGRVCYFSASVANPLVKEHVRKGGRAVVLEEGINGQMITIYDRKQFIPLLWTHLIPATFEGRAMFNVANAMAAAAMAYCGGVSIENIRHGLRTFATTFFQAPGRLNIFEELGFKVIVDYAHNAAALRALADFLGKMPRRGMLIGAITCPGDRRDQDIEEFGRIAGRTFDYLIFKEDDNRRGRQVGEVAERLRQGAMAAGMASERITLVLDEMPAVDAALNMARPDDVVLITADEITAVWKRIIKRAPRPTMTSMLDEGAEVEG